MRGYGVLFPARYKIQQRQGISSYASFESVSFAARPGIGRLGGRTVAPMQHARDATIWRRGNAMTSAVVRPHVLCVGGEDHQLRIPFLLEMVRAGARVSAAGTAEPAPFTRAGLDYWPIQFNRFISPGADRATIRQLRNVLGQIRPHIVQSFDTKPNVLVPRAARDLAGIRVVRTINGLGWVHSSRSPLALMLRPVQCALHRRAARWCDATVFQNRQDLAYFQRKGLMAQSRAELIPGSGIDIDGFDRGLAEGSTAVRLRESLGLGDAEVVITVTRLTRQKGIPTLLKAAALVHRVRPAVRFVLVGPRASEGPLAVTSAEIERHAPYVVATGPRSDVPALLRMADVFVFPTEYREGVPRALLEAALAELPLIATNMPGCDEVVRDRWSGRLVNPRAPRELAAAILDLLANRAAGHTMGARAAETVRSQFGLASTVERYRDVYRRVLESGVSATPRSIGSAPKSATVAWPVMSADTGNAPGGESGAGGRIVARGS
jgi:glycosyltransferase involved in cell wall biosynthesis